MHLANGNNSILEENDYPYIGKKNYLDNKCNQTDQGKVLVDSCTYSAYMANETTNRLVIEAMLKFRGPVAAAIDASVI